MLARRTIANQQQPSQHNQPQPSGGETQSGHLRPPSVPRGRQHTYVQQTMSSNRQSSLRRNRGSSTEVIHSQPPHLSGDNNPNMTDRNHPVGNVGHHQPQDSAPKPEVPKGRSQEHRRREPGGPPCSPPSVHDSDRNARAGSFHSARENPASAEEILKKVVKSALADQSGQVKV